MVEEQLDMVQVGDLVEVGLIEFEEPVEIGLVEVWYVHKVQNNEEYSIF